ncbi:hypothetical protein IV203_016702 [Nitzschia inconspicua]|uniref:Uncharacterized protein n=1 Tax=Nitzschia inconspicua TaxID=303405 RepID=A0A9K3PHM0_9STRA|nr:hypothetical protein IV203_016702 [Nitzschia inconspicua]
MRKSWNRPAAISTTPTAASLQVSKRRCTNNYNRSLFAIEKEAIHNEKPPRASTESISPRGALQQPSSSDPPKQPPTSSSFPVDPKPLWGDRIKTVRPPFNPPKIDTQQNQQTEQCYHPQQPPTTGTKSEERAKDRLSQPSIESNTLTPSDSTVTLGKTNKNDFNDVKEEVVETSKTSDDILGKSGEEEVKETAPVETIIPTVAAEVEDRVSKNIMKILEENDSGSDDDGAGVFFSIGGDEQHERNRKDNEDLQQEEVLEEALERHNKSITEAQKTKDDRERDTTEVLNESAQEDVDHKEGKNFKEQAEAESLESEIEVEDATAINQEEREEEMVSTETRSAERIITNEADAKEKEENTVETSLQDEDETGDTESFAII